MPPAAVRHVVVLGAGSAGYLAALGLRSALPDVRVTVIRDPRIPVIGVGESTTPIMPWYLHDVLGLDRADFYRQVRPTWKMGVRFDWAEDGDHFYYPFDMAAGERRAGTRKVDAYFMMREGRAVSAFTRLMDRGCGTLMRTRAGQIQLDHTFAYHIHNPPFIEYLERAAIARGVHLEAGGVRGALRDEDGYVTALVRDDGTTLAGDFFVDCSGFSAFLLGKIMAEPFVDYASSLFNDTAVVGGWKREGPADAIQGATFADMMEHGWCWRIELSDRVNRGYVFSSRFTDVDRAVAEFRARNPRIDDVQGPIRFRTGRRARFWVKNVAAVGNASGFVEPIEATALHVIVETVRCLALRLAEMDGRLDPRLTDVANAEVAERWDDVREFIALHYRLNRRGTNEYWQSCRRDTVLGHGAGILEVYRRCGPTPALANLIPRASFFQYEGYLAILLGMRTETQYAFTPSDGEAAAWRAYLAALDQATRPFLPLDEALGIVTHPSWRWPADMRIAWSPALATL